MAPSVVMHLRWIAIAALVPATAWPCQPRPPSHRKLVLLTAADATLPADGAILVTYREVPGEVDAEDAWTVEDGAGKPVAITVEDLGSDLERWVPAAPANRDLTLRDHAHAVIATLHQTASHPTALAAPSVRAMRSTFDAAVHIPQGVPGGTTKLELGKELPARARYLTIAIAGSGARAHSAVAPTSGQRLFESTSYAHKSCAHVGPGPIAIGQRVSITWVDELGRRSPPATATVSKL